MSLATPQEESTSNDQIRITEDASIISVEINGLSAKIEVPEDCREYIRVTEEVPLAEQIRAQLKNMLRMLERTEDHAMSQGTMEHQLEKVVNHVTSKMLFQEYLELMESLGNKKNVAKDLKEFQRKNTYTPSSIDMEKRFLQIRNKKLKIGSRVRLTKKRGNKVHTISKITSGCKISLEDEPGQKNPHEYELVEDSTDKEC